MAWQSEPSTPLRGLAQYTTTEVAVTMIFELIGVAFFGYIISTVRRSACARGPASARVPSADAEQAARCSARRTAPQPACRPALHQAVLCCPMRPRPFQATTVLSASGPTARRKVAVREKLEVRP